MDTFTLRRLSFTYPSAASPAISELSLNIERGQFVTLCGKSGCGKTTLLRQLKPALSPHGLKTGDILFENQPIDDLSLREQSRQIGFVLQSPDNQIVTDKVWHELAFGLESLGCATPEIRARVAEMASFFGIQTWFHKNVSELSGGQKQLLNLASVMVMQPGVLLLDEPTSQLDPIAATDFLETLGKINRELGTTIILSEHRLEDAFPMSDRIIVMDCGKVVADGAPREVGETLKSIRHDMFFAMPTPMRIYAAVPNELECPITVRDGRAWLENYAAVHTLSAMPTPLPPAKNAAAKVTAIELSDVWFRYGHDMPDILKGLSAEISAGELYAIVGGNGTGKTTSLSIMTGILKPYRGAVRLFGRPLTEISDRERYGGLLGVLPQNPQSLFVKKTVELDLYEMFADQKLSPGEQQRRVEHVSQLCELAGLLRSHPYDLSGGEQQRAALAKVLLLSPRILLLDEPTKGLDGYFKEKLARILARLTASGVTIVMVSHDIEFCAAHADSCAMFFDGAIVSTDTPRRFFSGKSFYTTSANRMARAHLPDAVLCDDVVAACGGSVAKATFPELSDSDIYFRPTPDDNAPPAPNACKRRITAGRMVLASVFALCFVFTAIFFLDRWADWRNYLVQLALVLETGSVLWALFPSKKTYGNAPPEINAPRKLSGRTVAAMAMILLAVPATIFIGIFFMDDRKYYFISMLIILETMLPFALLFEKKKPQARELVIIAVLCAIGVAGRAAFFMLPHFKPVLAIVIISGVCFGGETGFLVGAITAFVSNMLFGQGPWTPWQMFAFGIIGFLAGVLFRKGVLRKRRGVLCVFGALSALVVYGVIMDVSTIFMYQYAPTWEMCVSAITLGIPFNIIHAAATVLFLWFISDPLIEKLDRIKTKYGLIGN